MKFAPTTDHKCLYEVVEKIKVNFITYLNIKSALLKKKK